MGMTYYNDDPLVPETYPTIELKIRIDEIMNSKEGSYEGMRKFKKFLIAGNKVVLRFPTFFSRKSYCSGGGMKVFPIEIEGSNGEVKSCRSSELYLFWSNIKTYTVL